MELDSNTCYRALATGDRRFDGVFFVGVETTGVYCRTVCTARKPRRRNCRFFPSAAAAERAGFRPCLRCRPELAPGAAPVDSADRLALLAASRIQEGVLTQCGVADLAREMGITDRHLRRIVRRQFGVSPVELVQTERLLMAKRLLTDTDLPVTEIAFASGFNSLRRFNAVFRERYRLAPTSLRRRRPDSDSDAIVCELAYRPPFDWESLLAFLALRAIPGVEQVDGPCYRRTAAIAGRTGWITAVRLSERPALRVEVSASLVPVLLPVLSRVRRLFDLHADPVLITDSLGPLAAANRGLRVPGAFDGFELAVRAVLGQQVSVKGATTLAGRFVSAYGERIETPYQSLTHVPPSPERVAAAEPADIAALGIVTARAEAIVALARAEVDGRIALKPSSHPEQVVDKLCGLPGIGEWTAHYIAMRALGWPDAFPHTDLGIRKALGNVSAACVLKTSAAWRPWRAYAAMHLWKGLENTQ